MLKVTFINTRKRCEICLLLAIKTSERYQWLRSCVFIVNFGYISHLFCVSIVDIEQVNICWNIFCQMSSNPTASVSQKFNQTIKNILKFKKKDPGGLAIKTPKHFL